MMLFRVKSIQISPVEADVDFPSVVLLKGNWIRERYIVHVTDPAVTVGILQVHSLLILCWKPAANGNPNKLFSSSGHGKCSQ